MNNLNHNEMRDDHDTHTHTDYSDTYSYGIVYVDNDIFHVIRTCTCWEFDTTATHGCCNVHKLYDHDDNIIKIE